MTTPAYRLRPNKAVDRFLFLEALQHLAGLKDLSEYTYYGLGGPFLEDVRILGDFFNGLRLVSIEENEQTVKRQQFHLPSRDVRLLHMPFHRFLKSYAPTGEKGIFWLDYTRLLWEEVDDFMMLIQRVEPWSMAKITLRVQPRDFEQSGQLRATFAKILPPGINDPPARPASFAALVLRMLRIATQRALKTHRDRSFQPISAFFYNDSTPILTLTGLVSPPNDIDVIRDAFESWEFANLSWNSPTRISVPALSTKERLTLQSVLPCDESAGKLLEIALGYMLGDGGPKDNTQQQLKQYAAFHKYYPYYITAQP